MPEAGRALGHRICAARAGWLAGHGLPRAARDRGHLTAKLAVTITRASQPDPGRAARLGMDALAMSWS